MCYGARRMTPGQLARKLLGRHFVTVGGLYRSFFLSAEAFVESFPTLPDNAHLLDVGGGDGYLLDLLLRKHPQWRVTMTDLAPRIGLSLSEETRPRVRMCPGTPASEAIAAHGPFDAVLLSDVLHHVPPAIRPGLLAELAPALKPGVVLCIKDVEPGSPRSVLGEWSDRYVSGDKNVEQLSVREVRRLVAEQLPGLVDEDTPMYQRDAPNYMVTFRRP